MRKQTHEQQDSCKSISFIKYAELLSVLHLETVRDKQTSLFFGGICGHRLLYFIICSGIFHNKSDGIALSNCVGF